jgi:hypothetical protein
MSSAPKTKSTKLSSQKRRSVLTVDRFYDLATPMRNHYEERFGDPRSTRADRFIWDYWNVPDQYTALRTPAYHFFPKKMYDAFHQHLVWWGRRNLGCHDVSPPWMSCYIDGCKQEFHGDLPHGPWAFVFSLTPWQRRSFSGGETILLKDEILSYWQNQAASSSGAKGLERGDVVLEVPPLFNRLTVFDPRIPHGVREVRGPRDVLEGRLVIHGWFVQPRPFIEGPLPTRHLQSAIDDLSGSLNELFSQGLEVSGLASFRLKVNAMGRVAAAQVLANSLRHPAGDVRIEKALLKHISEFLKDLSFGRQKAASMVTLPIVFETQGPSQT